VYYDAVQSSDDFEYQDLPGPSDLYYMDPDERRVPVTPVLAEFDEFNTLTDVGYTCDDPPHDANAVEAFYEEPYVWQAPDVWAAKYYNEYDYMGFESHYDY
jgi:hypothetical protein